MKGKYVPVLSIVILFILFTAANPLNSTGDKSGLNTGNSPQSFFSRFVFLPQFDWKWFYSLKQEPQPLEDLVTPKEELPQTPPVNDPLQQAQQEPVTTYPSLEQPAQKTQPSQPDVQQQPVQQTAPSQPAPQPQSAPRPQPVPQQPEQEPGLSDYSKFEQRVVELVNDIRLNAGLKPLIFNPQLSRVARIKAEDMRDNNYFSHQSPTYGSPFEMMKNFGISYRVAGENIAAGQRTPEAVVSAWMDSPGHRSNILNANFTAIGVGHATGGSYGNYWVQQFIGR